MFMNRWLIRQEVIELNHLDSQEQLAVFAILKPFHIHIFKITRANVFRSFMPRVVFNDFRPIGFRIF
jgi:hypothetical protein